MATPAGLVVRAFVAMSLVWFFVPWLVSLCRISGADWYGSVPWEAREQLRSIRHRLAVQDTAPMNEMFYEGKLFCHTFYGLALVNMATACPEDADFRAFARNELATLLPKIANELDSPQFSDNRDLIPVGGVILAGQANLLRAGYVLLGGTDGAIIEAFHATSATLFEEYQKSRCKSLESYPNLIWPVDNCCALESLRLHDVLFDTSYSAACREWERWMAEHLDESTGMMLAQISLNGDMLEGSRGCALSWSLAFMPRIAPELARSQYEKYRRDWFVPLWGTAGIREWPIGHEGFVDPDTGPIVFGIGGAASGFGIAAAKANGDQENLTRMLRGLELTTVPLWTFRGKHMFGGLILLADEISLWGRTLRAWDAPLSEDRPQEWPPVPEGGYWLVLTICLSVGVSLLYVAIRSAGRTARALVGEGCRWTIRRSILFLLAVFVCVTWILVPMFHWFYAMLTLGIVDIMERRVLVEKMPGSTVGPL